ncbi:hypothetical protein K438DRAFT_1787327 [Mycena galopus ATCC 62051]|nr:hypothetical protein K438DRAFT_1787327 [Mycena galopus ATCC 62051]
MPAPMDSCDVTPTPQPTRASAPASAVEVSGDVFPPFADTTLPTVIKVRATKTTKVNKGKVKATKAGTLLNISTAAAANNTGDNDDLAADNEHAVAASLGHTTSLHHAMSGASSSCHPAAGPGSPPKRLRSNTAGDAALPPFTTVAATTAPTTTVADTTPPAEITAPTLAGARVAALAAAPAAAPIAAPVAAPAVALTQAAAPAIAVVAAPAAAVNTTVAAVAAPTAAVAVPAATAVPNAAAPALPPMWLTVDNLPPRSSYGPDPGWRFPRHRVLARGAAPRRTRRYIDGHFLGAVGRWAVAGVLVWSCVTGAGTCRIFINQSHCLLLVVRTEMREQPEQAAGSGG